MYKIEIGKHQTRSARIPNRPTNTMAEKNKTVGYQMLQQFNVRSWKINIIYTKIYNIYIQSTELASETKEIFLNRWQASTEETKNVSRS